MQKIKTYFLKMNVFRLSLILSLLFLLIFIVKEERGLSFGLFDLFELKTLDMKFLDRGEIPPHDQVVIAAVDEKSINRLGLWPWSRIRIAQLVFELKKAGAEVIVFDVIFSDEERLKLSNILRTVQNEIDAIEVEDCRDCDKLREKVLDFLDDEIANSDPDKLLSQAMQMVDKLVLGFFLYTDTNEIKQQDIKALRDELERIKLSKVSLIRPMEEENADSYPQAYPRTLAARLPLEIFTDSTDYFGHFNFRPDEDGSMRWVSLLMEVADENTEPLLYPALSLQAAAAYLDSEIVVHTYPEGVHHLSLGLGGDARNIPVDKHGRLLINYHGPERTFPHYPAVDIIEGKIPPENLKGKVVLVGVSATAVYDLRVTPFQKDFPGVEIHANVIDNILNDDYISRPWWAKFFEMALILFLGLFFGVMLSRLSAIWGASLMLFVIGAYYLVEKYVFFANGHWVNFTLPTLLASLIFLSCYVYRYMTEEREKRKIKGAFKQYLSESVVDHLMENVDKLKLGGDKREITVLFTDVRSFTTVSEGLTPEQLGNFINEYLNPMTEIVLKYEGVLDKYVGDEVMAFWGAPLEQPDHARRACETGLDMLAELDKLNRRWESRGMPTIEIGVGVNTGMMWVGNMGSNLRFDYSLLGDNVNLGARLEGTNKQYGTHMIISEHTHNVVKEHFICRQLDSIRVKGKNKPVTIYELIGRTGDTSLDAIARVATEFERGLSSYRAQRWDEAIKTFEYILKIREDDPPSRVFLERCRAYKDNPPAADWDGAYTMMTK